MRITAATFVSILLSIGLCAATTLDVGMRVPALTLTDQHGADGSVSLATRCVFFNRDMASAKIVQEGLTDTPSPALETARTVVVSDISAMPSIITKLFAVPAMRKRPYRILLDRDGKVTSDFPSEKGKVTVLYLKDLTIERLEFVDSAAALRAALHAAVEQPAAEPGSGATPQ